MDDRRGKDREDSIARLMISMEEEEEEEAPPPPLPPPPPPPPSGVEIPGKLFVGGLKSKTNGVVLRAYFNRYGTVTEARVLYDLTTGRSRQFGFVTFEDPAAARRALDDGDNHRIDEQKVDVKQAVRKEDQIAESSRNNSNNGITPNGKKIFAGGLPKDITDDEFRAYFEQFGPITDAIVMKDKNTNAPRGFGFVTFETEEMAHEVLKNQFHELRSDKKVEVKIAIPKSRSRNRNSGCSGNSVQNYNPSINNFPPSEYTPPYTPIHQTAVGCPQSICNYTYPYAWYHPIGYGPMGYRPMGLYYVNPNITGYESQMQPANNFQNGGHYSNVYNNCVNLMNFRDYQGYTSGGNSTGVANLANERASPSINTAETSKPRAADEASDSNEEQ